MGRLSLYFRHHLIRRIKQQRQYRIKRQNPGQPRSRRRLPSAPKMDDDDERRVTKKMKLDDIALKRLIDSDNEDSHPPQELEVVPTAQGHRVTDLDGMSDEFKGKSDLQLEEMIRRNTTHLSTLSLPDKGAKIKLTIKKMEAEMELRKRVKDAHICRNEPPPKSLNLSGAAVGQHQDTPLSYGKNKSQFFYAFNARLEQSDNGETGSCNPFKKTSNGPLGSKGEQTSKDKPFQCPTGLASKQRRNDYGSLFSQRSLPSRLIQKVAAPSNPNTVCARRRQEGTVVLLDDEDSERDDEDSPLDNNQQLEDIEHDFKFFEDRFRGSKISYPSRNDPTHVDIDFVDLKCLDPEAYLSSPIMNFYIRYLQQPGSPMDKSRCAFHFFNTFFYSKLKAAVSDMGNDNTSFTKFRRWWKGINLFHKSYILIPVHEDQHWSLIIICIPYKDKETGPIILHLDSLGLHNSRPIFKNIKRFIGEEWDYWTHESASSVLPWEKLPRRLEEKTIAVPQQKNEYDCGLFVLHFMERFIAEAPDRLSRRDLYMDMFGRQWFKPAEASELRTKIHRLLVEQFKNAQQLQK